MSDFAGAGGDRGGDIRADRDGDRGAAAFAHASEAEFARILDFYEVSWRYEPDTFPILWDLDGNVVESFAPDFFLPEFNLYVELTTLQQRLVRKKNRKVRRLRELYPGIGIKLFYARDFRALMLKYGRAGLIGELSGTIGQVSGRGPDDERVGDSVGTIERAAPAAPGGEGHVTDAPRPPGRSRSARRRAARRSLTLQHLFTPDARDR